MMHSHVAPPNILEFCRLLQWNPNRMQQYALLDIQKGEERVGLRWGDYHAAVETFTVGALWRGLFAGQPSVLVARSQIGEAWLKGLCFVICNASFPVQQTVNMAQATDTFIPTTSGVHMLELRAPSPWWAEGLTPGGVDVVLGDFDWTPTEEVERACKIGAQVWTPMHVTPLSKSRG